MSGSSQRPVSGRSTISLFYILAIGAGVMRTFSVGFDIVALNTFASNPIIYGLISQWVSFAITLTLVVILSIKISREGKRRALGYELDPDFGRISLLPSRPMLYLFIAGSFAGISTFFYYILAGSTDASVVLPYGQLVIIYLLIGDLVAEKDTPTIIELQCVVSIMLGVMLVGIEPGGFNVVTLLIVLLPMNVSSAVTTFLQRKTKRYELSEGLRVDSLNMRIWSLLFLNIIMTALSIPFIPPDGMNQIMQSFDAGFWLMVGSSVATFFSLIMYIRALGRGTTAIVNSLSSISVVLGIPMTLIGNFLLPGAFGGIASDSMLWVLKIFGVTLVMMGVIALEASDVRSLVIVNVEPQVGDILPELFAIKGVESVSGLAGKHDYILSIKSRSLSKARTKILHKIQKIPGVKQVNTLVILRDHR
ncbi:Lrp/AsnC family transcriptional regulator [Candidatus Thorarchaeota archaeon]|nr:MAG: Lrp/AsnC family transcriptional regulator [Candidatus Thorarchaeota archaeon]